MSISCEAGTLRIDLYRDGALVKRDLDLQITGNESDVIIRGKKERGYNIAQIARDYVKAPSNTMIKYHTRERRPVNPNYWGDNAPISSWLLDCEEIGELKSSYVAINVVSASTLQCDKARILTVDLFLDGKLFMASAKLGLVYDKYIDGSGVSADLLEAARLYVNPGVKKMMGIVYVANKKPSDTSKIPWYAYGTYVTDGASPLLSCATTLDYQKKYVAINVAAACDDDVLVMSISWQGAYVKQRYVLPISYTHGERKFGESRVDLVKAVRAAIPYEMLLDRQVSLQFFSRDKEPDYSLNWSIRKPGVKRLMATCEQVRMLQNRFINVNLEPIPDTTTLKCSICPFDAEFHNAEKNEFYCSLQCHDDSIGQ